MVEPYSRVLPHRSAPCCAFAACAVDGFRIGTSYNFSCASDCAGTTCEINKASSSLVGSIPDVFHRLACESKIVRMCAPPHSHSEPVQLPEY
jgi:hypothetical protein